MKIYNTQVSTQNFGSAILVILRGTLQDVNETFNSFYNLCGANGSIDISESSIGAIGVFWTNEKFLRRYWQNRFLLLNPNVKDEEIYSNQNEDANVFVDLNFQAMRNDSEVFINFNKNYFSEEHSVRVGFEAW